MVTAHGASQKALRRIRERGLKVVEATCPLVHRAHEALTDLVRAGYYPVVIGLRGHVEVRGMTEDLDDFEVVLSEEEVKSLRERPRFGIVAQTTQPFQYGTSCNSFADAFRSRRSRSVTRSAIQPSKGRVPPLS
jgi:4-hydroxy-3-methylbut-2-enyl diphosphate reductase